MVRGVGEVLGAHCCKTDVILKPNVLQAFHGVTNIYPRSDRNDSWFAHNMLESYGLLPNLQHDDYSGMMGALAVQIVELQHDFYLGLLALP